MYQGFRDLSVTIWLRSVTIWLRERGFLEAKYNNLASRFFKCNNLASDIHRFLILSTRY